MKSSIREESFCKKYGIKILNNTRRCIRSLPPFKFFQHEHDKDIINSHSVVYDSEPCYTIEIPKSKFEALIDVEGTFYNNIEDSSSRNIFQTWMQQQSEERYLRNKYAAVKLAYENYSAMLAWVKENPTKFKDLQD
jgi:hypothetical protein